MSKDTTIDVMAVARQAREAGTILAQATTGQKNAALVAMAERLETSRGELLKANQADCQAAAEKGIPKTLQDRLVFNDGKISSRIGSLHKIAALPDPVGQPERSYRVPVGLGVSKVRVPLGVVMMIYEARPHVTVNAGAFCLKSGNASILRGGSEAARCNALLGQLWQESLEQAGLPRDCVQVISGSHEAIHELLELEGMIDLVIPRGGKKLIEAIASHSRIPVIKHFHGVCHVYIDETADFEKGIEIMMDSKLLMPEVCNAMESLLVHQSWRDELPRLLKVLKREGVTIRGCERTVAVANEASLTIEQADASDWETEYLDKVLSIRMVDDVDQAIAHINGYGSHHTDSIVTEHLGRAERFTREVDSGVVLVNASTMYCDGESLGMGAEIGISTDKLHARGPMGLEELTSMKYVIRGQGHTMGSFSE